MKGEARRLALFFALINPGTPYVMHLIPRDPFVLPIFLIFVFTAKMVNISMSNPTQLVRKTT